MFTAQQAAASVFLSFGFLKYAFFEQVCFGVTEPCLRLNRRPQALCVVVEKHAFWVKENLLIVVKMSINL